MSNRSKLYDYGNGALSVELVTNNRDEMLAFSLIARNDSGADRVFVGTAVGAGKFLLSLGQGVKPGAWPQPAARRVSAGHATISNVESFSLTLELGDFNINAGFPAFSPPAPLFNGAFQMNAVTA